MKENQENTYLLFFTN